MCSGTPITYYYEQKYRSEVKFELTDHLNVEKNEKDEWELKKLQSAQLQSFYREEKGAVEILRPRRALHYSKYVSLAMKFLMGKTKLRPKRIYYRSRFWQKPTALGTVYI